MQRSTAKRRIGSHAPMAAIVLNKGSSDGAWNGHGFVLVVFMRILAALWIAQGLLHWNAVLGIPLDGRIPEASLSVTHSSAVVFFAIIDLIASVGLWLTAPWGGVIWLVGCAAQILVALAMPDFYPSPYRWPIVAADVVLVSLYMILSWQAAATSSRSSL